MGSTGRGKGGEGEGADVWWREHYLPSGWQLLARVIVFFCCWFWRPTLFRIRFSPSLSFCVGVSRLPSLVTLPPRKRSVGGRIERDIQVLPSCWQYTCNRQQQAQSKPAKPKGDRFLRRRLSFSGLSSSISVLLPFLNFFAQNCVRRVSYRQVVFLNCVSFFSCCKEKNKFSFEIKRSALQPFFPL